MFSKLSYSEVGLYSVSCIYHLLLCLISVCIYRVPGFIHWDRQRNGSPKMSRNCASVLLRGRCDEVKGLDMATLSRMVPLGPVESHGSFPGSSQREMWVWENGQLSSWRIRVTRQGLYQGSVSSEGSRRNCPATSWCWLSEICIRHPTCRI